jgi:hypothetical protein
MQPANGRRGSRIDLHLGSVRRHGLDDGEIDMGHRAPRAAGCEVDPT